MFGDCAAGITSVMAHSHVSNRKLIHKGEQLIELSKRPRNAQNKPQVPD